MREWVHAAAAAAVLDRGRPATREQEGVLPPPLTLPQGCRPAQALQAHLGTDRVHFDEVIVGYANSLGQLEFSATVNGRRAHGKGALDCPTPRIVAFGLGTETGTVAKLCPPPPRRTHAIVACVRHWR